jgi:hypothetical protein
MMQRCCRNCGKTDHNVRTGQEIEETSGTDSCIEYTWFFVFVVEQLPLEVGKVHGSLINHVISVGSNRRTRYHSLARYVPM